MWDIGLAHAPCGNHVGAMSLLLEILLQIMSDFVFINVGIPSFRPFAQRRYG